MFHHIVLQASRARLSSWAQVASRFAPAGTDVSHMPATYPVLRRSQYSAERIISPMRLGLIPSYAHDDHSASQLTEARAESVTCATSFRSAFRRRRCLIPATAFTEPSSQEGLSTSLSLNSNEIFAIAGIWETWVDDNHLAIETFAMINVEPSLPFRTLFSRMPVVIAHSDYDRWLGLEESSRAPLDLLRTIPGQESEQWRMERCPAALEPEDTPESVAAMA